ncbi:MAG: ferrous iron transport protein A [Spirulinaceae cyanobacterium RM2_2_10]|nr:ferrous iron transport protein A [Spirulinaceae cyanobacterium SM2_1_0]NJO19808.1 ferrous iron transport protein A [Spirulinaceae cyanobacterium RM2_2_10]
MFPRFSTTSSALKLLQVGECGRVTRIASSGDRITTRLHEAGIKPGALIMLEQRFPRFIVRVGSQRLSLSIVEIHAISVRLAADCSLAS